MTWGQDKSEFSSTIREFLAAVGEDDNWPLVEDVLRRAVRVVVDEWRRGPSTNTA